MSGFLDDVDRLGPYRLVRMLGSGSMGTVFLAEGPGGRVALKVLHPHLLQRPDSIRRFEREADAGARVAHPNVVRTLDRDVLDVDGRQGCVLVMEHVEGRTLRETLGAWGSAPEALVREIARQIAAGLGAIHAAGIVHRDLKPENVMITADHRVRIMDLGVARLVDDALLLSTEGQFAGSLPYAAPEQLRGEPASPGSDLYSLGTLLFELLTGELPFAADDVPALLHAHLEQAPPRADARRPEISAFLTEVVDVLLAKTPTQRFASAEDVGAVLAEGVRSTWWAERLRDLEAGAPAQPRLPVRRETRLYGRETELALLSRCWEQARQGQGNTALLVGEAGIGKTRLVDAFLHGIDARGAHLLYGSYAPSGGKGGVSDAILSRFGTRDLEDAVRPYVRTTPALVPAFVAGIRQELPQENVQPMSDDALQTVLVQFVRGLAEEQPLVWVVEDLHFAEPAARRRVLALARALEGHRVLLVLTTRRGVFDEELADLGRHPNFRRCELSRLGACEVILLLKDASRSDALAERLGGRIALKSDGIPFFVFEMVRDLKEKETIAELPDGTWVETRAIEEIEVPSAIRDLVAARMADLTKSERRILDVGAVQGYEFDPHLTAEVLGREVVDVLQDLAEVERRSGILRTLGRNYRFDHHQIQVLVYDELPAALREAYHAGLAEAIAAGARGAGQTPSELDGALCATLCEHHLKSGRGGAALEFLDVALEHLASCYLQDEAVDLAHRALTLDGVLSGPARAELLRKTADRLHLLGRVDEESRALDEAVALADASEDMALRARVRADLGRLLQRSARYEEASAVLLRAIEQAQDAGDRSAEIRAVRRLGGVYYGQGRLEAAREQYERQQRLAVAAGDALEEAHAVGNLGTVLSDQSRYTEARTCFERHLDVVQAEGDRQGLSVAHGNLGVLLSTQGLYDEARPHLEQQLSLSRAMGDRQGEARATGSLGYLAGMQSRFPEAIALHERHLAITREIGDRRSEGIATANLGNVFVNLGRYDEARTCLEDWLEISREIGSLSGEARANGQLGFVCLVEGRTDAARRHFERWLDMARSLGDRVGESYALGYLGDIAFMEDRFEEARTRYERRLDISQAIEDRRGEGIAHAGLGAVDLALGHTAAALDHYERRLELACAVHDRQSEGSALGSLGNVFAAQGRRAEAGTRYEQCLAIAREIGDRRGEACALGFLGRFQAEGGSEAEARRSYEQWVAICTDIGDRRSEAEARLTLGGLLGDAGRDEDARLMLVAALGAAREVASPALTVRAACRLARLHGEDTEAARVELAAYEDRLGLAARLEARLDLWEATGDAAHLAVTGRLYEQLIDRAPPERRELVVEQVALCRRARAALSEEG